MATTTEMQLIIAMLQGLQKSFDDSKEQHRNDLLRLENKLDEHVSDEIKLFTTFATKDDLAAVQKETSINTKQLYAIFLFGS